jgi:acetyl/propionyl-CoA carboxylase alpha subunit
MPSTGKITRLVEPGGPGVRVESGIFEGLEISLYYDPLIAKVLSWGETREEAISRMRRALSEYWIHGIKTTIPFHTRILTNQAFLSGKYDTSIVETVVADPGVESSDLLAVAIAAAVMEHSRKSPILSSEKRRSAQNPWRMAGRRDALRGYK